MYIPAGALLASACAGRAPSTVERARALLATEAVGRAGALWLRCDPEDADVALDGVPQGSCIDYSQGRGLAVGEGMHHLEVTKPGHYPYQTFFEPGGTRASLTITLTKALAEGAVP